MRSNASLREGILKRIGQCPRNPNKHPFKNLIMDSLEDFSSDVEPKAI